MGRKAKLKKAKRQAKEQVSSTPQSQKEIKPTQFVRQLESQGYALKKIERSPDLPSNRAEPQI